MLQSFRSQILLSLAVISLSGSVAIAGEQCNSSQSKPQSGGLVQSQFKLRTGSLSQSSSPSSLSSSSQSQGHSRVSTSQKFQGSQSSQQSSPPPCKDENDTNCYSMVTLECR